jgi:hypothetical protein
MNLTPKILLTLVVFLTTVASAQTIFVAGNNASTNDVRKELVKGAGKKHGRVNYCLTVVQDPAAADYRLEVSEKSESKDGFMGLTPVAATLTTKTGILVDATDSRMGSAKIPSFVSKAICKN